MKKDFLLATFEDDIPVLAATKKARDKNIAIYDIYTPFPVHGLDEAMGIKRSILPYVTLLAGAMGLMKLLRNKGLTGAERIWDKLMCLGMHFKRCWYLQPLTATFY